MVGWWSSYCWLEMFIISSLRPLATLLHSCLQLTVSCSWNNKMLFLMKWKKKQNRLKLKSHVVRSLVELLGIGIPFMVDRFTPKRLR